MPRACHRAAHAAQPRVPARAWGPSPGDLVVNCSSFGLPSHWPPFGGSEACSAPLSGTLVGVTSSAFRDWRVPFASDQQYRCLRLSPYQCVLGIEAGDGQPSGEWGVPNPCQGTAKLPLHSRAPPGLHSEGPRHAWEIFGGLVERLLFNRLRAEEREGAGGTERRSGGFCSSAQVRRLQEGVRWPSAHCAKAGSSGPVPTASVASRTAQHSRRGCASR